MADRIQRAAFTGKCRFCGVDVQRKGTRGARPRVCPSCRSRDEGAKISKICGFCGQQFVGQKQSVCCSASCANRYRSQREGKLCVGTKRNCVKCGSEFEPVYSGQCHCSAKCANKTSVEKARAKAVRATCKQCGDEFNPKHYNRTTFCSRDCSFAYLSENKERPFCPIYPKACRTCGALFIARLNSQAECSEACKREKARLQQRARASALYATRPKRICAQCAQPFFPIQKRRLYCSIACSNKAVRKARKAQIRGSKRNELVSIAVLVRRDGNSCHICGLTIDFNVIVPDDKAATIDHLVPLSMGGCHTLENAKLAHFICNTFKSDRGITKSLIAKCRARIKGKPAKMTNTMVSGLF